MSDVHLQVLWFTVYIKFNFKLVGAGAFLSVAWPPGVQLLVLFCSSVPVVLFNTAGISRNRSQHIVSVESSSLFRHSIYLRFICFLL